MNLEFTCPYCGRPTTITDPNYDKGDDAISIQKPTNWENLENLYFSYEAITCPNPSCKKLNFKVFLKNKKRVDGGYISNTLQEWQLLPESEAKILPDYIPQPIQQDYYEACRIRDLSPKASATLSRRCLQGMIRDFRGVKKGKLAKEIEELKGKVSDKVWKAIDSVRSVGNIGAHMEEDINYIIDVEPDEAKILIKLIEFLIENWYIKRNEEELGLDAVIKIAEEKKEKKKEKKE